ncbi:MAG: hypothetical protein EAZ35_00950 [Sphingobacteriia bacterium]|nr:MAG: hypothetical protein EAZ41_03545 [Sphingobacteriia bacterium]TAG32166.1 MAG: hypothetical protein EAZ35_00950 [Sphingobacteriia bacterium]
MVKNKNDNKQVATIRYSIAGKQYQCALEDGWLYSANEKIVAIVAPEYPEKAKAYCFWGYWLNWREFIASIAIGVLLFQVAVSITNNPTPEALIEQLSYKEEKKTKYDF